MMMRKKQTNSKMAQTQIYSIQLKIIETSKKVKFIYFHLTSFTAIQFIQLFGGFIILFEGKFS